MMKIEYGQIKLILSTNPEGISLDDLLEKLRIENINTNRIYITSVLKWRNEVKRIYTNRSGKIITKYKIEKISE